MQHRATAQRDQWAQRAVEPVPRTSSATIMRTRTCTALNSVCFTTLLGTATSASLMPFSCQQHLRTPFLSLAPRHAMQSARIHAEQVSQASTHATSLASSCKHLSR